VLFFVAFFYHSTSAQLPYLQGFSSQNGKGVVGTGSGPAAYSYDTTGMSWTMNVSATSLTASTDYFKVVSGAFEGKDLDGEAVWYSKQVDISSVTYVDLSVDVFESGDSESSDYINIYYSLDGGVEILFSNNGENTDDFTSTSASQNQISGSTVTIIIKVANNTGTETHKFDNVSVTEGVYNSPSVGDVLITEYGRQSTANNSYLELYNTTSTNIDLSAAKIISSGSNDAVYDFGSDITSSLFIPANGFLLLNRNASQATFESAWSVSLSSNVNYVQTDLNAFGNQNKFKLRLGGTSDTDDGTLIDESTIDASSLGKRIYQMPQGYWTNNEDDYTNATPGSLGTNENISVVKLAYADGAWHAATGYGESAPSATTASATAIVMRGQATFTDNSVLDKLTILANAGTSLTNQDVVVNTSLIVANNASLSITGTGSITSLGSISIEREGHNLSSDFNIWGTPFSSAISISTVFTNHFNCDFYVFEASTQSWKFDETVGTNLNCAGNLYALTSGMAITSGEGTADGAFDIGRGYFIPGNAVNAYSFTKASGGVLNNGDISVGVYGSSRTASDGSNDWNLISNPYPSSISVTDFLTENAGTGKLSNAIYVYNPGNGMNTVSSYDTYNSSHTSNYIASCQGFYVNGNTITDGLAYSIDFKNSMRHHTNTDFRAVLPGEGIYLDITDSAGENDPMRLYFDADAQDGWDDKFDAYKLMNSDFNFCTKLNDHNLVFNGMSELDNEARIIPLYFQTYTSSVFTLELDSLVGTFSNTDVLLEDRYRRTFHNLKQQGYAFSSAPKEWANRFYLHIVPKKTNTGSGNTDTTTTVTGIEDVIWDNLKVFYSNNEIVVSSLSGKDSITEVQVIRTNGQIISTSAGENSVVKISTIGFSSGLYFVRSVIASGAVSVSQVVIH
jgi:hypothetical protein